MNSCDTGAARLTGPCMDGPRFSNARHTGVAPRYPRLEGALGPPPGGIPTKCILPASRCAAQLPAWIQGIVFRAHFASLQFALFGRQQARLPVPSLRVAGESAMHSESLHVVEVPPCTITVPAPCHDSLKGCRVGEATNPGPLRQQSLTSLWAPPDPCRPSTVEAPTATEARYDGSPGSVIGPIARSGGPTSRVLLLQNCKTKELPISDERTAGKQPRIDPADPHKARCLETGSSVGSSAAEPQVSTLRLAVVNPTAILNKDQELLDMQQDVFLLSETSATAQAQRLFASKVRPRG